MSQKKTNLVTNSKIMMEPPDESDYIITCRICNKCFASEIALRNHASMEHIDAFCTGNPETWMLKKPMKKEGIKKKTEEIIGSMAPTDLMTLASEDVDYIIIKAEDAPPTPHRRRKGTKTQSPKDKEKPKDPKPKEPREIQPITGPFECLQPSVLVADGTCHQIFFSCCEYSTHFRDEHTRRRKGLRCQVCEKPLAGGEDLAPFTCEVCGAGFQMNRELSDHMASDHVKLKPFECSVCHKRFTQQGGVQQHMRMHTGDRPFNCTFCPKAFTQKSGLDQHLRIHLKVKPYRCVICSKTFVQSVHLRQHMRVHTNVSPFQCGICLKRFKQSSHLNYHLKNHNPKTMTEKQQQTYKQLIQMMNDGEKQVPITVIEGEDGTISIQETTELEIQEGVEVQEIEEEMEGEGVEMEGEEMEQEEIQTEEVEAVTGEEEYFDEEEQILAEQSIRVVTEHSPTEYVIPDA